MKKQNVDASEQLPDTPLVKTLVIGLLIGSAAACITGALGAMGFLYILLEKIGINFVLMSDFKENAVFFTKLFFGTFIILYVLKTVLLRIRA